MKRKLGMAILATGITVGALPQAATAQISEDWKFGAVIYGYFPSVGGKTTFPSGSGSNISVSSDTIIDDLKFAFMGALEAQKGRWGLFTDVMYVDVGGSKSQTRDLTIGGGSQLPAGVTSDLNLDIKGTVWTLGGSYRLVADPTATFDVLAGARLIDAKETFGWQFSGNAGSGISRSGSSEAKLSNWDGIVGVKGQLRFGANREWFVPYYLDVGTGESDLTWQAIGGIGYSFRWGDLLAGWRYLDYEFDAKRIEDLNFSGPFVGLAFRW